MTNAAQNHTPEILEGGAGFKADHIPAEAVADLVEYCMGFYGPSGPSTMSPVPTLQEVEAGVSEHIAQCRSDDEWPVWGGGDSMDRERVRSIIDTIRASDDPHELHAGQWGLITSRLQDAAREAYAMGTEG